MRIKNQKDFWAGLMFIGFGAFFAGFGIQYNIGTAERMGPGYFPTMLGIIVIILGLIVAAKAVSPRAQEEKVDRFSWPTLAFILGSVVLFGALLRPLGLVISLAVLVIVSSLASHEFKWRAAIVSAVFLIVMCLAIFVWGLNLQFTLWPAIFTPA